MPYIKKCLGYVRFYGVSQVDRNDNLSACIYTVTDSPESGDSNEIKNEKVKASPFFCAWGGEVES